MPIPYAAGAVSPVTSHVLDTALGRPAPGVLVQLQRAPEGSGGAAWDTFGEARTNVDGRVPDLLPPGNYIAPGVLDMQTPSYYSTDCSVVC